MITLNLTIEELRKLVLRDELNEFAAMQSYIDKRDTQLIGIKTNSNGNGVSRADYDALVDRFESLQNDLSKRTEQLGEEKNQRELARLALTTQLENFIERLRRAQALIDAIKLVTHENNTSSNNSKVENIRKLLQSDLLTKGFV